MPAVTPEEVLRAGCHHLVLDRILFVVSFACLGESEGLEGRWILVYLVVHMNRKSGNTDMGTLRDERAVREREILHGLALHRDWEVSVCMKDHRGLNGPHPRMQCLSFALHEGNYPVCAS